MQPGSEPVRHARICVSLSMTGCALRALLTQGRRRRVPAAARSKICNLKIVGMVAWLR